MNANLGFFLHRWAKQEPERIGIIDAGRDELALSYGDLDRQASRLAARLREDGLGPGDRVAICTANGLDFVAAWFGAIYAGCATLPVPASSTAREIAFRLQHSGCRILLSDRQRAAVAKEGQERAGTSATLLQVDEAIAQASGESPPCDLAPEAMAMLLYTSGTTGAAKGVCISHGSLGAHSKALVEETIQLDADDCVLGTLPLTHSYGIRTSLLLPFFAGARTVFLPRFSPRRSLELCSTHRVTWLPGVPTMFIAWANEGGAPIPRDLRWCMSAGAPLVEDVRLRAEARLGAPVRQAYGLTEANLTAINAPPDEAVPGCSGKPVAGVEIRIANESGQAVPEGEHGEVLIRGQNVMSGYLDDKMASAHVLRGGWLHSGDIGFVDPEGRLSIVDRSKDLILRGGASIYPSEIENVFARHPAVEDVAVVGKPDEYYGEEVVAVIVAHQALAPSELDEYARERLAPYKLPRHYAFVDSLPRGGSGKTLKRRLRAELVSGELRAEELSSHRTTQ